MGKRDCITKDFALYVVHYFNSMLTWSKEDILGEIDRTIKEAKPEDVERVVHGIWLVDDYDSGDPGYYSAFIEVHCSKCGYELGAESGQYGWCYGDPFPLNYCPNCGAKMELGVKGA